MTLIQCEYKRFGQIVHIRLALRIGEHFRIYRITISLQNKLYLCRIDNTLVQFLPCIVLSFFTFNNFNFSRITSYFFHFLVFKNCSTILRYLCLDTIHTTINIYTIQNRLLQSIVYDDIIIKECPCFRSRSCCQTY